MIWDEAQIIGIDEVQFFGHDIILLVDKLVAQGRRVIVAGLDLDFRGIPFGCMPTLMALADDVTKLKAVCMQSGKDAHFSQRLIDGEPAKHTDPIVMVGAEEAYEARSRACHEIDRKPLLEYVKQQSELTQE
jgi:thymidine kinase